MPVRLAVRGVLATLLATPLLVGPPGTSAVAAPTSCAAPKGVYQQAAPWPQRLLGPQRLWPMSDGTGQTVAVIGTGVDARNRQFGRGQVLPGVVVTAPSGASVTAPSGASVTAPSGAAVTAGGRADDDCDGRGTFAAGLVAARPDPATTFAGLAPGARLLPIRYTQSARDGSAAADPRLLATALHAAVDAGAGVLLVVVPAQTDAPQLHEAVAYAMRHGALVVSPAASTQTGATSYPTAYPDVLGVGAVDEHGAAVSTETGGGIVLAAPGADLVGTAANSHGGLGHQWAVKDPEFAAAYVAGAAALLRAYRPTLTPDQVRTRLLLTADRPPSAGRDPHLGWGVVDPYAALTSMLPADAAPPGSGDAPAPPQLVVPAAAPASTATPDRRAGLLAVLGLVLAGATALTATAVRRGNARRWRPGRVRPEPRPLASSRR